MLFFFNCYSHFYFSKDTEYLYGKESNKKVLTTNKS